MSLLFIIVTVILQLSFQVTATTIYFTEARRILRSVDVSKRGLKFFAISAVWLVVFVGIYWGSTSILQALAS